MRWRKFVIIAEAVGICDLIKQCRQHMKYSFKIEEKKKNRDNYCSAWMHGAKQRKFQR